MARDDDWLDDFLDDGEFERPEIKDILFGAEWEVDKRAQALFFDAFFEDDKQAYAELIEYMWDEYDIDFEAEFDWEDFKEWYE